MRSSSAATALAALSVLGVGGLVLAGRQASDVRADPPDVRPGTKIYELEATEDSRNVLTAVAANAPIEVLEVRGDWVRVDVPNLAYGPVWLNFEQVVYYRTTRDAR